MTSLVSNSSTIASPNVNVPVSEAGVNSEQLSAPNFAISAILNQADNDSTNNELPPVTVIEKQESAEKKESVEEESVKNEEKKESSDKKQSQITTSLKVGAFIAALFAGGFACFWFILDVPLVGAIGLALLGGGLFLASGYYLGHEMKKRKEEAKLKDEAKALKDKEIVKNENVSEKVLEQKNKI